MKSRSIRFKMVLSFSLLMIALIVVTVVMVRVISGSVLRRTIRGYLYSMVEENTNKLSYETEAIVLPDNSTDILIPYEKGFIRIDDDFLDVVNDVCAALYSSDGVMLYGENPIAQATEDVPFSGVRIWRTRIGGVQYDIYDRSLKLTAEGSGDEVNVWIRGMVPETESMIQLRDIDRVSVAVLPVLMAAAVVFIFLLAGSLLAPIREIDRSAAEISKGDDLKKRIEIGPGDDEVHRLAATFNSMLARLDRSFEAEKQFTSDASHELRTPMSVIMAQCEYTLEEAETEEEFRKALRVIRRQGAKMNSLISEMLDYTRLDQNAVRYPLTEVNLSALIKENTDQMAMLKTNDITINSKVEAGLVVSGNESLLTELITNLISNAYRYGRENGAIRVLLRSTASTPDTQNEGIPFKTITSGTGKGRVVLSVWDNGMGISEDEQIKIFDRFYRSDKSRSSEGTGLGLALVKKICEFHNAELCVRSVEGKGSEFRITFP